ncbi:MFS transporter [Bradyrhizobium sp. LHD-71]|uniref:MFS transporter n=1 Tax=Bradyrhizobium sp. LHD-71 TaxID=3072141 RepID=UPI00280F3E23|nr:MFS transporter [Bradyrhizobium sp. LHD-71]MDQ8729354.1 MFS transporter [Bradyrhizobium sp. LHD-71]
MPRQADFWRLWLVGLMMFTVRWIELLVVAVFTYQVTGSAFIVTMMTLLRLLPMALFGAFMGAWADRLDRRLGILAVLVALLLSSAAIAGLAWAGRLEVWHLAVSCFINGTAWATDNALRRIMIGEVVGADKMATAMAFDIGANNASRMVGPAVGGVLIATAGIEQAYIVSVGLYLVGIGAAFGLKYREPFTHLAGAGSTLSRIVEGLREARRRPHLLGIYLVTAIYNIFGWPIYSLVPVIGKDNLDLGPGGVGLLSSMDGVGAMLGAASVAMLARPAHFHALYVGAVAVFQLMMVGFALMSEPFMAGTFLVMAGISGACFAVMQTTLIYRAVTPELRSRMLGLLSVSIGIGPIGFLQIGLFAEALGAGAAVIISSLGGLLALALTFPLWRPRGDAD